MSQQSRQKAAQSKEFRNSFQGHFAGRSQRSDGPEARAMQDRGFGGRGHTANQEQARGIHKGKKNKGPQKKAA